MNIKLLLPIFSKVDLWVVVLYLKLCEVPNFQDDMSVSGSGTVVIRSPGGSHSSPLVRDQIAYPLCLFLIESMYFNEVFIFWSHFSRFHDDTYL